VTDRNDFDERVLRPIRGFDAPPPPPSPKLASAVETMRPVPTRTRFGAFIAVGVAGLIWPIAAVLFRPLRRDLAALPSAWVALAAGLWGAAFVASLLVALVPRRTDVLPAPARAARVSTVAMACLFLFAVLASVEVPASMRPDERGWSLLDVCLHCGLFVVEIAAVFLVAGFVAVRRLALVGGQSIGLALGAAGGAMGGLVLHFLCPFAATAHVVLGHVGGMVLAAVAGAILVSVLNRRRLASR
jgi:hypothetical protein